jgi:hypothetical protein
MPGNKLSFKVSKLTHKILSGSETILGITESEFY